jgi:hypothetical protein
VNRENQISLPSMKGRAVDRLVEALCHKVPGSIPGSAFGNIRVNYFFRPDSVALGTTQSLTEISLGVNCCRRVKRGHIRKFWDDAN